MAWFLFNLLVRLVLFAISLALRLATALGIVLGRLLVLLLQAGWQRARRVRAATPKPPTDDSVLTRPVPPPTALPTLPSNPQAGYAPRPLRRRPRGRR